MVGSEAKAYQPELSSPEDTENVVSFKPGKTIWSDDFGRSEIIDYPVKVKRLERKHLGLHFFKALNDIKIYSFKYQGERKILLGRCNFRAYVR